MGLDIRILGGEAQKSCSLTLRLPFRCRSRAKVERIMSAKGHLFSLGKVHQGYVIVPARQSWSNQQKSSFHMHRMGQMAKRAYEKADLPSIFAYHPCASVTGPGSFNDFWEQDYGKRLIVPKS